MPGDDSKVPRELQRLADSEDDFYDDVYAPYSITTTETPYRYLAYFNRVRTILLSAQRYVAYSSEIGESFRPVAHPHLVRSAYAISWSYIAGDVLHEGYKAYLRNRHAVAPAGEVYRDASSADGSSSAADLDVMKGMVTGDIAPSASASLDRSSPIPIAEDYRLVMAQRAVFQSLASMALPAFTVHAVVKHAGRAMRNSKSVLLRTWGPVGLGLCIIPTLPYVFDEPVEMAVEWGFRSGLRALIGEDAVRPLRLEAPVSADSHSSGSNTSDQNVAVTWEEYKAEKQRARDERMRQREEKGIKGPWALLGFGSSEPKDKSE
ncbi:hypothetical protein PHISP_00441 [Aspergillus sp. HF37]|nr:hypothetical protein PHISP_00441 [Aspergillus sp. HF37]